MKGLIGHTGFVGSNLMNFEKFNLHFNSQNIHEIHEKKMKILVCAGAPGSMIHANRNPKQDRENINNLINHILQAKPERIVLISTIGVFNDFGKENNEDSLAFESLKGYGLNRRYLEQELQTKFSNLHIVRLPSLIGVNLKKNFIFDVMNQAPTFLSKEKFYELQSKFSNKDKHLLSFYNFNEKEELFFLDRDALNSSGNKIYLEDALNENKASSIFFHSHKSTHQFYNLKNLWKDICKVIELGIPVMHLATQPLKVKDIHRKLLGLDMPNTFAKIHHENMETKHSSYWNINSSYIESQKNLLNDLHEFFSNNFLEE